MNTRSAYFMVLGNSRFFELTAPIGSSRTGKALSESTAYLGFVCKYRHPYRKEAPSLGKLNYRVNIGYSFFESLPYQHGFTPCSSPFCPSPVPGRGIFRWNSVKSDEIEKFFRLCSDPGGEVFPHSNNSLWEV